MGRALAAIEFLMTRAAGRLTRHLVPARACEQRQVLELGHPLQFFKRVA